MKAHTFYNSYLEVDLHKIARNMQQIQSSLPQGVQIIPVLKCNAYGLGAVAVARAVCESPWIKTVAVAQVCEGIELRNAGIAQDIFVLGGVPQPLFAAAVAHDIGVTVFHADAVQALQCEALAQGKTHFPVQIKIETGLHRAGAKPGSELAALIAALKACPALHIAGVFSHFVDGETVGSPLAKQQFVIFQQALAQLKDAGIDPPLQHLCNSGASDWFGQAFGNAVRIGRRLYMDSQEAPLPQGSKGAVDEVCSWRASITNVRTLEAGETIGYEGAWVASQKAKVATVCVGYGDGLYGPLVAAGGLVLVGEQRAHLVGTCMDQCFVDVTHLSCAVGDEITFFGHSSAGTVLCAQEVAAAIGTEGVSLTSLLSARVARVYTSHVAEK